jgi:hypothetical protein
MTIINELTTDEEGDAAETVAESDATEEGMPPAPAAEEGSGEKADK